MKDQEASFKKVISLVLRYGVLTSFLIVAAGSAMLFFEGQTGYQTLGTASGLFDAQSRFLVGPGPLLQGVAALKPYAVIDLGLIVLLATPVARVVISIFLFAQERRYAFVGITSIVLAILLLSMLVVAPLVSP